MATTAATVDRLRISDGNRPPEAGPSKIGLYCPIGRFRPENGRPSLVRSTHHVWFHWHARAHHHPGDCAPHLRTAETAGAWQIARPQPERIQEGVDRSAEHPRAGNQDRGAKGT